jgi:hypothetical protein
VASQRKKESIHGVAASTSTDLLFSPSSILQDGSIYRCNSEAKPSHLMWQLLARSLQWLRHTPDGVTRSSATQDRQAADSSSNNLIDPTGVSGNGEVAMFESGKHLGRWMVLNSVSTKARPR